MAQLQVLGQMYWPLALATANTADLGPVTGPISNHLNHNIIIIWLAQMVYYLLIEILSLFQKTPEGENHHLAVQLYANSLIVSQNLDGKTLMDRILLTTTDASVSHVVHTIIGNTFTNVSLDQDNCMLGTCVTFSHTLIGLRLYLNERLQMGGVADTTAYIRSKLTTFSNFTGCLGVSRHLFIINVFILYFLCWSHSVR